MTREPFTPADGLEPRWRKLYRIVMDRKVGQEITYNEALDALGFPHQNEKALRITQSVMREAQKHLEHEGHRTVGTVAKFGWIVLDGQKELGQVERRLVKVRRAAGRTARGVKALNGRREELSQFERQRLDFVSHAARVAASATGRNGLTLDKFHELIKESQRGLEAP